MVLTAWQVPHARRGRRAARRRAARTSRQVVRAHLAATVPAESAADDLDELPVSRWWGHLGRGAMWGPAGVKVPMHETSTARVGVLTPFVARCTGNITGPLIGVVADTGEPFRFDPWGAYQAHLVTSPGMVVFGLQGYGKSMCVKTLAVRTITWGRKVIVASDPKGEWRAIAKACGGEVIRIGPGTGTWINPLDEGVRPGGTSGSEWTRIVADRRGKALRSIARVLDSPLGDEEQSVLDHVVTAMSTGALAPTITALVDRLREPPPELTAQFEARVLRRLALVYGRLASGPLSGMFEHPSNVRLDPGCPMTVLDTSVTSHSAPEVRKLATICRAAWIDATLRSQDGCFRLVVHEEGWSELDDPQQVEAMNERLRMAGEWGCANVLVFHEYTDIEQFGDAGSAHRNQVAALISKSPIKVLYRQSVESMPAVREALRLNDDEDALLPRLQQGVGLWRIGDHQRDLVHPLVTPVAYELFNTDRGREG
ncbi:MAG TPA: hypothetical protein VGC67_11765 [Cellulomonas sp.]